MAFQPNKYELPSLRPHSNTNTPTHNKLQHSFTQQRQSLNDEVSLSYSHTNKNTNKFLSYDSEAVELGRFVSQQANHEDSMEPKYHTKIGDDLAELNNKLEHLQECFLNMSTISQDNKQNVRPGVGMMKKSTKNSRNNSKENFITKRTNFFDIHRQSHESTKRHSRRGSILERSDIQQVSRQREISSLRKQVSFCQKSLSASRQKGQILSKRVEQCNQKIRNYKILERKAKKLQVDYSKLVRTLQKSEQVRLKQKSLIQKYQEQIKRLHKLVKTQK